MITPVINTKEYRDVGTIDIPNFFIQTPIDRKTGEKRIIMKINVVLVNILV